MLLLGLLASFAAQAQLASAPRPAIEEQRQQERERSLREQQERAVDARLPRQPSAGAQRLPDDEATCFYIHRLVLEGELAADFQWALRSAAKAGNEDDGWQGRCLGTEGVNIVLSRVQQAVIEAGYVTTRVLAGSQDLLQGVLTLTLVPGRIWSAQGLTHSGNTNIFSTAVMSLNQCQEAYSVLLRDNFESKNHLDKTIRDFYKKNGDRVVSIFCHETGDDNWILVCFLMNRKHVIRYGCGQDRNTWVGGLELGIGPHYFSPFDFWDYENGERFPMEASTEGVEKSLALLDEFLGYQYQNPWETPASQ